MIKSFETLCFTVIAGLCIVVITSQFGLRIIAYIVFLSLIVLIIISLIGYYRNRTRIRMIRQHIFDPPYWLKFEAMNLGDKSLSMERKITLKCLLTGSRKQGFLYGKRFQCDFYVDDTERILEPHRPRKFTGRTTCRNQRLPFSWFRKYEFRPTRGMNCKVFVRNAHDNGIPCWKYKYERLLYRLFNIVKRTRSIPQPPF
jgi:hypothetical protein